MKQKRKAPPEVESVLKFISENMKLSGFSGELTPETVEGVMGLFRQGKLRKRKPILETQAWLERLRKARKSGNSGDGRYERKPTKKACTD